MPKPRPRRTPLSGKRQKPVNVTTRFVVPEGWDPAALAAEIARRYPSGMAPPAPKIDAAVEGFHEAQRHARKAERRARIREARAVLRPLLRDVNASKQTAPPAPPFVATPLQRAILEALKGRALKKRELADVCKVEESRLYKPGALRELRQHGKVDHKHGVGFYRPDAPPPGTF